MRSNAACPRRRIVFISSCRVVWGGSEELWYAAALALAKDGHSVTVLKYLVHDTEPHVCALRAAGISVLDIDAAFLPIPALTIPLAEDLPSRFNTRRRHMWIVMRLRLSAPDLVVVSQGINSDGYEYANLSRQMKIPYVLVAQKASELYWPHDASTAGLRKAYQSAERAFFVCEHNRRLTEEQLGVDIPGAEVVRNPFLVPWEPKETWPEDDAELRLACIGRFYPKEKGQDLLLRVLARQQWRDRPLRVTFYGVGVQGVSLECLASRLGLKSVTFAGFVDDVSGIWATHHGLVLPSRCEGLPLVVVETMLSGRVPIVTDVGGSGEVVEDGVSGFLIPAPTETILDETLERAWNRRDEWRAIGRTAARQIRTLVPRDPGRVFANALLALTDARAVVTVDSPLGDGAQSDG